MSDVLVRVDNVSKKFCRSLKKSLWYGVRDMTSEFFGVSNGHCKLRDGEFWANKDISFEVKRGETIGLIGQNGAGKTTLLRMLNGLIKPDSGRIEVRGSMQALIALCAGFNPILTGRENIYVNAAVLGIPKVEVDRKFDEIVDFSGVGDFIDSPVQSYSSGMAVRLGFAVAAHMEPDILLVDEVLAVGDEGFQSKCLNKIGELKQKGTAIILVSHNMHTISTFSTCIYLMDKGSLTYFENVSIGITEYRKSFETKYGMDIQKIVCGNKKIIFDDLIFSKQEALPMESIKFNLKYQSTVTYDNVEVDVAIYSSREFGLYFQATNKAYNKIINLQYGRNELVIELVSIPLNDATAIIAIAIWTTNRNEILFWWRIPIYFERVNYSTGNNFIKINYN